MIQYIPNSQGELIEMIEIAIKYMLSFDELKAIFRALSYLDSDKEFDRLEMLAMQSYKQKQIEGEIK
jgi:hypothetical protein